MQTKLTAYQSIRWRDYIARMSNGETLTEAEQIEFDHIDGLVLAEELHSEEQIKLQNIVTTDRINK